MSGRGVLGLLAAVAAMMSAGACASARMRVDPAASRVSRQWDVDGANPRAWGAPLRFGPYEAASVQDGTTFGWSVPLLGVSLARDHRPYGWRMTGGRAAVDAECHQVEVSVRTASAVEVDVRGASGHPVLACAFRVGGAGGDAHTWTLALRSTGTATAGFRGTLREGSSAAEYEIASSHELERSHVRLGSPAGFLVTRGDDLVTMIETLGRGHVWMAKTAADLDALAAAGMALLLFRPPG